MTAIGTEAPAIVPPPSARIPVLDGVRGLAIISVMLFHAATPLYRLPLANPLMIALSRVLNVGWAGVELFFVLSGFLITRILLNSRAGLKNLRHFYARRALRILPLYYGVIAFVFLVLPLVVPVDAVPGYRFQVGHQLFYWLYIPNWMMAHFGRPPNFQYVMHFWSLAIEEQFYLIWPAAVYLLRDRSLKIVCLAAAGAELLLRIVLLARGTPTYVISVHTLTRFDGLLFGGFLALMFQNAGDLTLWAKWTRRLFVPIAIGTLAILLSNDGPRRDAAIHSVGFSLLGLLFSMAIGRLILSPESRPARLFTSRSLRFFGKYSYALYVFHWPILLLLDQASPRLHLPAPSSEWRVLLLYVPLCFVLSIAAALASWHLWEKRFLSFKEKVGMRPIGGGDARFAARAEIVLPSSD